jgi:hypothetical protein
MYLNAKMERLEREKAIAKSRKSGVATNYGTMPEWKGLITNSSSFSV